MAKGEIARFEQFLLLSLCFQKAVYMRERVEVVCWELLRSRSASASSHVTYISMLGILSTCVDFNKTEQNSE